MCVGGARVLPADAWSDPCASSINTSSGDIFATGAAIGSWVKRSMLAQKGHWGQVRPIG